MNEFQTCILAGACSDAQAGLGLVLVSCAAVQSCDVGATTSGTLVRIACSTVTCLYGNMSQGQMSCRKGITISFKVFKQIVNEASKSIVSTDLHHVHVFTLFLFFCTVLPVLANYARAVLQLAQFP